MLKCTVKLRSGEVAVADAPFSIQGEFYVVEMTELLANNIWDGQGQEYLIQTGNERIGNFTAICTNFIATTDGKARCFFVRSEFLPQQ